MSETKSETREYKGIQYRVRKHWSGSIAAFVIFAGELYSFKTIKAAKSFIDDVAG